MSFYDATVPVFIQTLGALSGLLTKAEAHCKAKNIAPEVLLGARLYPDMLPLTKQIQLACDFATKGCARLTHGEVPSTPDTEKTFGDLKQRIAGAIVYVKTFKPAQFEGADANQGRHLSGWPEQFLDAEGAGIRQSFRFSEFLFPCRDHAWNFAPQRRRNRQA